MVSSIVPARLDKELLREYSDSPRFTENNAAYDDVRNRQLATDQAVQDSAGRDRVVLSTKQKAKQGGEGFSTATGLVAGDGKEARGQVKASQVSMTGSFRIENAQSFYGIGSEDLKDQYSMKKITLDFINPAIGKYREALSYRGWNTTTFEVYA